MGMVASNADPLPPQRRFDLDRPHKLPHRVLCADTGHSAGENAVPPYLPSACNTSRCSWKKLS